MPARSLPGLPFEYYDLEYLQCLLHKIQLQLPITLKRRLSAKKYSIMLSSSQRTIPASSPSSLAPTASALFMVRSPKSTPPLKPPLLPSNLRFAAYPVSSLIPSLYIPALFCAPFLSLLSLLPIPIFKYYLHHTPGAHAVNLHCPIEALCLEFLRKPHFVAAVPIFADLI